MLSGAGPTTGLIYLIGSYLLLGAGFGLVNAPTTSTARQVGSSIGIALLGSLAFTGFADALPSKLAALHLSRVTRVRLLHGAGNAASNGSIGHVPGVRASPAITHAIGSAFTTG